VTIINVLIGCMCKTILDNIDLMTIYRKY